MEESGIDMGFDLAALAKDDLGLEYSSDLEQALSLLPASQDFMYYELKSRAPDTASPPTFKTATPTSRTQLKLQLMREQLQEQERREAEFRQSLQQQRPAAAPPRPVPPTPLPTIGVDVPPQVLQVRTLLENPTRYHVVQKQKNQVRQYLHESFRSSSDILSLDGDEGGSVGITSSSLTSSEGTQQPALVDPGPNQPPPMVQSAPPGPMVHKQHHHLATYPHGTNLLTRGIHGEPNSDPTTGAMSPSLSSVATSNSEYISQIMNRQHLENAENQSRITTWRRRRNRLLQNAIEEDEIWQEFNALSTSNDSSTNESSNTSDASAQSILNESLNESATETSQFSLPSVQSLLSQQMGSDNNNLLSDQGTQISGSNLSLYDDNTSDTESYYTDEIDNSQDTLFREHEDSSESSNDDENCSFQRLKNTIENDDIINLQIQISKPDILLAVLKYVIEHDLCQTAMADLFKLINVILQQKIFPETRYLLDQLFNTKEGLEFHSVCPRCKTYINKFNATDQRLLCNICNEYVMLKDSTYRDYFVIIDIKNNISNLMKQNINYYDNIMNERVRNGDNFEDFYDGILYKEFVRSLSENDRFNYVTTTFNADGAPVFESSKFSIWPIQLIINELPVRVRNGKPIVCGLWFGKDKPDMNIFLTPFITMMNKLSYEGITFIANNEERCIKVYSLCSCVDSVARAPMQGLTQFNGYYGCSWCMHPGVYVPTLRGGSIKYILLDELPPLRTEVETFTYMIESLTSPHPVYGIKRPSSLINLDHFNIISGFVPDSMHSVSLGIAEQLTSYWVDSSNMPYSLNNDNITTIDNAIRNIKAPNQISRLSRGIKERKWWKAREWENWILYYSIPILSCFPWMITYLQHWAFLVEAFFILNQDSISRNQLNRAHNLLTKFVVSVEEYYSQSAMTYNVHQLLHLTQSVINWGPLWAHSGYSFESGNCHLLKKIHAAKGVLLQLCRSISMSQAEIILREYLDTKPYSQVHGFISYLDKKYLSFSVQVNTAWYFGPNKSTNRRWIDQLQLSNETRTYTKMVKDYCLYISYKRKRLRSDNSFAITHDNRYVRIEGFVVDEATHNEYVLCKEIEVENILNMISIKKIVNISRITVPIATENIVKICVFVVTECGSYICAVPNLYHY